MVKLKESNNGPIRPDRYYIWTWRPDTTNKIVTEKKLYRKHLTGKGYLSLSLWCRCSSIYPYNIWEETYKTRH